MIYNQNMKRLMLFGFMSVLMTSVSSQSELEAYILDHKDIAIQEMDRTGIPASIKLAQGLLESNVGKSSLSSIGNNHFGIKCGNHWEGKEMYKEDDDYGLHNQLTKSCFRVFNSANESYVAHSEFLLNPKKQYRYGFLFSIPSQDYVAWANGLQEAGYATDPQYAEKLISRIEQYGLYQYDGSSNPIARFDVPSIIEKIKDLSYSHIVQIGESLQSIASQYQMDPGILIQSNNIQGPLIVGQELNWTAQNSQNDATFKSLHQKPFAYDTDPPD